MDTKIQLKKPVIICGADVVGRAIFEVCINSNINVLGFCDYNPDLTGKTFCGLKIYYTPTISKIFKDAMFIISVLTIRDVVDSLHSQGITNWIAGGLLLEGIDTTQTNDSYQIDNEKYYIEACKIAHRAFLKKDHVFLRSIDIMITERCSLKCEGCSNLMQYFEKPRNYSSEEIISGIDQFLLCVDEILEARVLGGDAFMHPGWPLVVQHLVKADKIRRVMVYTNGVIVPTSLSSLQNEKIVVVMTNYGKLSKNLQLISSFFKKNKIWHIINEIKDWLDCSSIQKHNRTSKENDKLFQECIATSLSVLVDGRVFRCPFAASAFQLKAVENIPTDYIDVYSLIDKRRLNEYLHSNKAMSICDYCSSRLLKNKIVPAVQIKKPLKYERAR